MARIPSAVISLAVPLSAAPTYAADIKVTSAGAARGLIAGMIAALTVRR